MNTYNHHIREKIMETRLKEVLETISAAGIPDSDAVNLARERQKVLAKPTGALGTLEDISIQMAGITGK
jgi:NaMN:DMB phosphoribosyltransferase